MDENELGKINAIFVLLITLGIAISIYLAIVEEINLNIEREIFCNTNENYEYNFCIENYEEIQEAITQKEIERGLDKKSE